MKLRFFQLNIQGGRFLDQVIDYIRQNEFDIVHLQEVAGGQFSHGEDNLLQIKERIHMKIEFTNNFGIRNDPASYMGNATLFRNDIVAMKSDVVWMHPYKDYETSDTHPFEEVPRNAQVMTLKVEDRVITTINAHLAWGQTSIDMPHKQAQHKILLDYMKAIFPPFILSGDFNIEPNSLLVRSLNDISHDIAKDLGYPNTLNPRTHVAQHLFPVGTPVDYIFISPDISTDSFHLVDSPDLSDHFGIKAELSL